LKRVSRPNSSLRARCRFETARKLSTIKLSRLGSVDIQRNQAMNDATATNARNAAAVLS
jgi:hypothetical protein